MDQQSPPRLGAYGSDFYRHIAVCQVCNGRCLSEAVMLSSGEFWGPLGSKSVRGFQRVASDTGVGDWWVYGDAGNLARKSRLYLPSLAVVHA